MHFSRGVDFFSEDREKGTDGHEHIIKERVRLHTIPEHAPVDVATFVNLIGTGVVA